MSTHQNGISNSRSQSSDGESLPDDVFHDDSPMGGASGQVPPTASSTPPPKPLRVGGSRGLANLIKKSRELEKRINSESELATLEGSKESSKSSSDSKEGGGRRWSFKGGKGRRQQSVPVDVNLTGSTKVDSSRPENGGGRTGDKTGLSSSVPVSPQPPSPSPVLVSEATPTRNETTPTNNTRPHPLPPSSSAHSNTAVDLETVHEESTLESKPDDKSSPSPSKQKFAAGKTSESKPSPKPRGYSKQGRGKLFSDSQVLETDRNVRGGKKHTGIDGDKDDDSKADSGRKPGRDTLERDNMLLREQVKLLKGQNKKLKKENKEFRHKLQDTGEWDGPTVSSSTSQSESLSSCVVSPRDSPSTSKDSSRVPSESPSHLLLQHPHHEESMMSSSERTRLRASLSPPISAANVSYGGTSEDLRSDERSLALEKMETATTEEREIDCEEVRDVPGSLPSSSGIGASAMAGFQNGSSFMATSASKSKPIPVPRSTALSVGGASDVVKANEGKVTRGFLMRVQSLDSVPSSSVKTVKLESFVPKPESPVPKPRVITNQSHVVADGGGSSIDSNKEKEKEISQYQSEDRERTDNSNEAKVGRDIENSDDSNKDTEEKISKARKLLENVLPHQKPTKPSVLPRSMSTREDEGTKIEVPVLQRATSSSPIGKVGMVTLGDKSPISPGKYPGKSEKIEEDKQEQDEKATSMTSSNVSITSSTSSGSKTSPSAITKPLPPPPSSSSSSATKPLPPTPSSSSSSVPKPLPPIPLPSSSSPSVTKPLPPTPLSSSVPKPLPPTPSPPSSSSSSATKPLPPKLIKMSSSVPPSPPPMAAAVGKEKSGSISPKTPTASTRTVAGYKKVTIQSDTSWINRKKESSSGYECTDHPLETSTQSTGSTGGGGSGSVTTPTSVQSPGGVNRPHAPYRSHPILPGPSSGSSGSKTSLLSPGMSYGGQMELKPGPIGKPPPPKVLNSRIRTESLSTVEESREASKKGAGSKSNLLRSTSEENIIGAAAAVSTASAGSSSKGKGQSKGGSSGGFFSRTGPKVAHTPKEPPPPKKPARSWLRGKDKGSPPMKRPMSAVVVDPPVDDRSFTSSCTMPRGGQPEEGKYSPRNARRKPEDLSNGSPGKRSKGLLGRFKNKSPSHAVHAVGAPPLEEEPEDDSCSSSDDEKGGTIKFKPKLRHVSVKKPLSVDDDSEPEYHQLFEYVFVVGLKEKTSGKDKGKMTTELTYNFPPASDAAKKDMALQSIPQFCFPDVDQWKPVKEYKSESFSFVLTDMEGGRRYGYCRRLLPQGSGKRLPEVYCIVSPLGCFSLYEKILDHVEERRSMATAVSVFTFLKAIVANPFPRPGRSVAVPVISARGTGMETVVFERPMDSRLEHVDFSLLFNTLSQRKVIQVFSSLLMERRVILCAQSLSLVSGCAHALLALLYPFEWQHVFIPVLPSGLIDFVCSPLPYIIGINPSCIKQIETMETMEEALIVDLEKKKFIRKIGDEASILPTKLFQFLEHSLSSAVVSGEYSKKSSDASSRSRADEIVVNTFMTFFAYLYGDYKSFMSVTNPARGEKEFRRKDFVKKFSSKSTKRFLEAFQMTQMFENFIEQRENPSKAATVSESLFERKIPDLSLGCQEIEIFSSKSRFDRWRIKKGFAKNT